MKFPSCVDFARSLIDLAQVSFPLCRLRDSQEENGGAGASAVCFFAVEFSAARYRIRIFASSYSFVFKLYAQGSGCMRASDWSSAGASF